MSGVLRGTMSTSETPLTPSERIALVDNDKVRKNAQIGIALSLIVFAMVFLIIYAFYYADSAFLTYMATGILSLIFAGIGAAFAIFGLGRTVGSSNNSNNETILLMLESMKNANLPVTGPTEEFFDDNQDDDLDEEKPVEVPISRGPADIGAINVNSQQLSFLADRSTWHNEQKTINGKSVVLVATQNSRRTRSKRTVYVYHVTGTNLIIYNRSRHGIFFMRIAFRPENMQAFYDTFVSPPQTDQEKEWLERNDYILA